MSENEKKLNLGEPISEDQLDAVAGGAGDGSVSNPWPHKQCWFKSIGTTREDGRMLCHAHCKGKFDSSGPVNTADGGVWYVCSCWGTGYCIDKWHKPCGLPNRWEEGLSL